MHTFNYNNWDELYHHGVKGQHWGVRNYQNEDGTLKPAAYPHYGYSHDRKKSKYKNDSGGLSDKGINKMGRMLTLQKVSDITSPLSLISKKERHLLSTSKKDFKNELKNNKKVQKEYSEYLDKRNKRIKTALGIGAGLALTATAAKMYTLTGQTFIGDHIKNDKLKQKLTSFSYSPAAKKAGVLAKRYGKGIATAGLAKYAIGEDSKQLQKITDKVYNKKQKTKKGET